MKATASPKVKKSAQPMAYEKLYSKWQATKKQKSSEDNGKRIVKDKNSDNAKRKQTMQVQQEEEDMDVSFEKIVFTEDDSMIEMEVGEQLSREFPSQSEEENEETEPEEGEILSDSLNNNASIRNRQPIASATRSPS